jgi:hypothetical protein
MRKLSTALALIATMFVAGAMTLQAQTYSVRGTIQEFGSTIGTRPLAGATVMLSPGGISAVTDASGAYVLAAVPRGVYTLRVSAPAHQSLDTRITVNGDMVLNYVLQVHEVVLVTMSGTVTESGDFGTRALGGATVQLMPGNHTALTDASGHYAISNIPSGKYTLSVSAAGHQSTSKSVTLRANTTMNINLKVRSSSSGSGSDSRDLGGVIRDASGRGIAGVSIRLTPGNYQATTGSDGRFTLANVPDGRYMMHIRASGYHAINRKVTVGADRTIDFSLGTARVDADDDRNRDDDRIEREADEDDAGKGAVGEHGKGHDKGPHKGRGKSNGKAHGRWK